MKYFRITAVVSLLFIFVGYQILKDPEVKDSLSSVFVGWETLPRTADPRYATDVDSQYLEDLIHCSLVSYDKNGKIKKQLVKKFIWDTPKDLKIEIDNNFKFSNGRQVTVADIKKTYSLFFEKQLSRYFPAFFCF